MKKIPQFWVTPCSDSTIIECNFPWLMVNEAQFEPEQEQKVEGLRNSSHNIFQFRGVKL